MARLLIARAAGYVGSGCARVLAAAGHECVVNDSLSRGHSEFVNRGPLIEGDVRDTERLAQMFGAHAFDAVLDFAALPYVGGSARAADQYHDVNDADTRTLRTAMRGAGQNR